ncbi:MAG: hypothetical protein EOP50_00890 [Sphingobacteriales bacterium]|nr:MAG: hypothetical protein EOP50_00890 [Sphingobacteriales bacterium]
MIAFATLYKAVMKNEAGFNPNDQGARAYNGINERYHPQWSGWKEIDRVAATRTIRRGEVLPQLDQATQDFYKAYWKGAGLDTSKVENLKLAILLVDMCTQHGQWARVVNAGLQRRSPFVTGIINKIGETEYRKMNTAPAQSYKDIATARVEYVKGIPLQNEADRRGIINRAQSYLNDALKYLKENPGTSSAVGLLAIGALTALFFLKPSRKKRKA